MALVLLTEDRSYFNSLECVYYIGGFWLCESVSLSLLILCLHTILYVDYFKLLLFSPLSMNRMLTFKWTMFSNESTEYTGLAWTEVLISFYFGKSTSLSLTYLRVYTLPLFPCAKAAHAPCVCTQQRCDSPSGRTEGWIISQTRAWWRCVHWFW